MMKMSIAVRMISTTSLFAAGARVELSTDGRTISGAQSLVQLGSAKNKVYAINEQASSDIDSKKKPDENVIDGTTVISVDNQTTETNTNENSSSESANTVDRNLDTIKHVEATLKKAKQVSRKRRLHILMCTAGLALVLGCVSLTFDYGFLLVLPSVFLGLLAVMPSDVVVIRSTSLFILLFTSLFVWMNLTDAYEAMFIERNEFYNYTGGENTVQRCGSNLPRAGCTMVILLYLVDAVISLVACVYIFFNLVPSFDTQFYSRKRAKGFRWKDSAFKIQSRRALERLWLAARASTLASGINGILYASIVHALDDRAPYFSNSDFVLLVVDNIFRISMFFLFSNQRRARIMAYLSTMSAHDDAASASSIAALVGNTDPKKVLTLSKKKFRAISFDKLKEEDFNSNREKKGSENKLFSLTVEANLGHVDVFMSHSWSDDGPQKYKILQDFAEDFKRKEGRYPLIWLDKSCIDQTDIENDLLCLPIFLSGCKTLLVVPGSTYTSRLWCVMEIFTFLKMGGHPERIAILPINISDQFFVEYFLCELSDQEARKMFETIDVTNCECYLDRDRQKLLGIIQQGFGSFDKFNQLVQQVFAERVSTARLVSFRKRASSATSQVSAEQSSDCTSVVVAN